MIGEIGALVGGLVPNAMGLSKQHMGSYLWGFVFFAVLALVMLGVMRVMQARWTRTWAGRGGLARVDAHAAPTPARHRNAGASLSPDLRLLDSMKGPTP